jgi:hypothetical protein
MIRKINWLYGSGSIGQELPAIFAGFLNKTQVDMLGLSFPHACPAGSAPQVQRLPVWLWLGVLWIQSFFYPSLYPINLL